MSPGRRGAEDESTRRRAAGVLLLAVAGVLVLGWWLRTDRRPPENVTLVGAGTPGGPEASPPAEPERPAPSPVGPGSAQPPPAAASPPAEPPPHEPRPPAPGATAQRPSPSSDSLADRALRDARRLRRSGGAWTLQLMVACQEANARRIAALAPDPESIYVLGVRLDGRDCYRLCWGAYASEEAARADAPRARDAFGGALREMPRPRPVSELTE